MIHVKIPLCASWLDACAVGWLNIIKAAFRTRRGDSHWQHEPCLYAVRKGKSSNWSGDRTRSTFGT
jgi:hypothetical protein